MCQSGLALGLIPTLTSFRQDQNLCDVTGNITRQTNARYGSENTIFLVSPSWRVVF